jgi:hypothetical protein
MLAASCIKITLSTSFGASQRRDEPCMSGGDFEKGVALRLRLQRCDAHWVAETKIYTEGRRERDGRNAGGWRATMAKRPSRREQKSSPFCGSWPRARRTLWIWTVRLQSKMDWESTTMGLGPVAPTTSSLSTRQGDEATTTDLPAEPLNSQQRQLGAALGQDHLFTRSSKHLDHTLPR